MLLGIKKILGFYKSKTSNTLSNNVFVHNDNKHDEIYKENDKLSLTTIPFFHFSTFSNHTLLDVIITPVSENNSEIKLYIPENMKELLELKMNDNFEIHFKSNNLNVQIGIDTGSRPRIEIPSNHFKSIYNHSMGSLVVKNGVDIVNKITNNGSGNISVNNFLGQSIKNNSMGKITVNTLETSNLILFSDGSGNIDIKNGTIDNLESHTNSMGKVTINCEILSAKIYSNGSGDTKISTISKDTSIDSNSMGKVTVNGPSEEYLSISSSGSGKVIVDELNTKESKLVLDSMGNIEISGKTIYANINSSGSGSVKGQLCAENVVAKLNSMGDVRIEAIKSVKATITGMGSLKLIGEHVLDSIEAKLDSMGKIDGKTIKSINLDIKNNKNQCNIQLSKPQIKTRF